ncbi:MAG TPA: dicarboxylate/amino acid:cation symporter [Firmicutes bacterium]|nr:dicarboxylate/amino acid:cation symporter [Bacillota bacterium]
MKLHTKILIGFAAGIAAGALLGPTASVVKPLGDLFLRLIRMVIVPLVFTSLVVGAAGVGDVRKLGRIGGKTIGFFLVTTAIAVIIGLLLGNIIAPGVGLSIPVAVEEVEAQVAPSIVDTILELVPTNPFVAFNEMNMLQIIVFALFFGIGITLVGKIAQPAYDFVAAVAEIMYKLVAIIMEFAPFGVFGLIAHTVGSHGVDILLPLFKVIFAVYLGCILHALLVYSGSVSVFAKMSPLRFIRGIIPATLVAFSSCSSSGTLPITMKSTEELGVGKSVSSFVLPLGATINMDGTALYQGVCALFIAQAYGLELSLAQQLAIVLTATLASIGTAGVPGAGLVMLTMVLTSVNLPLEGLALVAGIDRILDMARTAINVTGDGACAVVVAATEGELAASRADKPVAPPV